MVDIIVLACLNLPIEIRYKAKNMYLMGIIPSPTEPSLVELNHYTNPVIDDMLIAWYIRLRLTWTVLHPEGLLVKCAIAIVVCDLPSARKTSQLASSISKIFCSVCDCWKVRDNRGNITIAEQDTIFAKHGIRWSPLWRLPY
ncbi:uncharacterized protein LAESUDRAFT_735617 [Laetiporus sulphureus 93-53]|uniref:Uncharacterized protein n=1 Tax=Laetiporus sulphureus 93-53 TaxID=1314785 RepID=A0A165FFG5_9APHY|nr:uncharacterized protein LAESUDRAFT_735617 [Laetiporus sulphureus 93-53]KZT08889.1 hypothetical protein LAESUDRAFT_735617 [Laetiporus sulphureus 93-53]